MILFTTKSSRRRTQMRRDLTQVFLIVTYFTAIGCTTHSRVSYAQCANDARSDEHRGILVTDFTVTGTTTLSSTEVARLAGEFVGSCFNDDSNEMQERVRAKFQDRGYFAVEVKSLGFKPGDPLGTPKPVTMEVEVAEGPKYKIGEILFVENHALSSERLRDAFPLKKGALFERYKVASGLDGLHKLYASRGFLDSYYVPDAAPSSNGTVTLKVKVTEGPQYHMGKLEILAEKDLEARLRAEWKMAEGATYDTTYIRTFLEKNQNLLPKGITPGDVGELVNCPEALVDVSLVVDPRERTSQGTAKRIPCESDENRQK
jgi:hypothetical protein